MASVTRLEMLACDVRIGQCQFLRRSALLPRSNLDKKATEGPDGRALRCIGVDMPDPELAFNSGVHA